MLRWPANTSASLYQLVGGKDSICSGILAHVGASDSQCTMVGLKISGSLSAVPDTLAKPISRSAHRRLPQVPQKFRLFSRPDAAVTV